MAIVNPRGIGLLQQLLAAQQQGGLQQAGGPGMGMGQVDPNYLAGLQQQMAQGTGGGGGVQPPVPGSPVAQSPAAPAPMPGAQPPSAAPPVNAPPAPAAGPMPSRAELEDLSMRARQGDPEAVARLGQLRERMSPGDVPPGDRTPVQLRPGPQGLVDTLGDVGSRLAEADRGKVARAAGSLADTYGGAPLYEDMQGSLDSQLARQQVGPYGEPMGPPGMRPTPPDPTGQGGTAGVGGTPAGEAMAQFQPGTKPPAPQQDSFEQVEQSAIEDIMGVSRSLDAGEPGAQSRWSRMAQNPNTWRTLLDWGLNTMAASQKPGATTLGAMGEGGVEAAKLFDKRKLTEDAKKARDQAFRQKERQIDIQSRRAEIAAESAANQAEFNTGRLEIDRENAATARMAAQNKAELSLTKFQLQALKDQVGMETDQTKLRQGADDVVNDKMELLLKTPEGSTLDQSQLNERRTDYEFETYAQSPRMMKDYLRSKGYESRGDFTGATQQAIKQIQDSDRPDAEKAQAIARIRQRYRQGLTAFPSGRPGQPGQ